MTEVTRILQEMEGGAPDAADRLAAVLYDELREIARREMAGERAGHTLQPTALVHEAFLRLVPGGGTFESRAHFLGAAANAIRRVLVEHARRRGRLKRGGDRERVDYEVAEAGEPLRDEVLVALDDALADLEASSPTTARIVELRFFAGMTVPEVARLLNTSESTVQRGWRAARAWLRGELEGADGS